MRRITPHLYQISLGPVNCFVIDDGPAGLILVDTGFEGSAAKIFRAIEKGGKSPESIHTIILTHTHPDHAGSTAEIVRRTGAKVIIHALDAALAVNGIAGRMPHVVSSGLLNGLLYRLFIKNGANSIPAVTADKTVDDNDVLSLSGGIHIIHTPGHSAGHISLYLQQDDVLIAGDLCANMMGLGLSTVYEDRTLGIRSILKAADYSFSKAVFGHGKPILHDAAARLHARFAS